jgi:hypothetical protein
MICASCVLFGIHKKHDILSLQEASVYLRDNINGSIKKGFLKKEFSESHLLEIREYQLRMDKYKNETVKKIEESFNSIIHSIKERKEKVIGEVVGKFKAEINKIVSQEQRWKEKQEISEKLLEFMNNANDVNLLGNSKYIMDGIVILNEPLSFKEIHVNNDIETFMIINRNDYQNQTGNLILNKEDLIKLFTEYMNIGDPNILEYKS